MELDQVDAAVPSETSRLELRTTIDAELERLPTALRMPVILCYLEGMTHDEAAGELRCPVGTVRSRMAKARTILRQRLARQGITADDVALNGGAFARALPPALVESTARASLGFAANSATASAAIKTASATLAKGALNTMMISKLKILGTGAIALVVTLAGVQTLARQHGQEAATPPAGALPKQGEQIVAKGRSVDPKDEIIARLERENQDLRNLLRTLQRTLLNAQGSGARPNDENDPPPPPQSPGAAKSAVRNAARNIARTPPDPLPKESMPKAPVSADDAEIKHFSSAQMIVIVSPGGDKVVARNG